MKLLIEENGLVYEYSTVEHLRNATTYSGGAHLALLAQTIVDTRTGLYTKSREFPTIDLNAAIQHANRYKLP